MKVMHVEAGKNLYGGALQVFYLLRELAGEGIENILVCPTGSAIAEQAQDCAVVEACTMRGDLDLGFVGRLSALIDRHQPDLVHVHSRRGADLWSLFAAKRKSVPAILTRRVDNPEPGWFARKKYHGYNKVVAISEGIRQVLLSEGVAVDHVRTIHSAVDSDKFSPGRQRNLLSKRFDVPEDALVVAVVAQLIERKGHRYLFEIVPRLLETFPSLRIVVLGKGGMESQLKQDVAQRGLTENIIFAGFHPDIENILPHVDIVAHPALMEGLGVALLQASACAVPIVGAAAGGIPEIVRHEHNGLLVPPADSEALYEALATLLADADLRALYGKNGRALVESDFSIAQMAKRNAALYREVLTEAAKV